MVVPSVGIVIILSSVPALSHNIRNEAKKQAKSKARTSRLNRDVRAPFSLKDSIPAVGGRRSAHPSAFYFLSEETV